MKIRKLILSFVLSLSLASPLSATQEIDAKVAVGTGIFMGIFFYDLNYYKYRVLRPEVSEVWRLAADIPFALVYCGFPAVLAGTNGQYVYISCAAGVLGRASHSYVFY